MNNNASRTTLYDTIRLLGTILVLIGHSTYVSFGEFWGGVDYIIPSNVSSVFYSSLLNVYRQIQTWTYGFHMPLFFMLSGSVLALRPIKKFKMLAFEKMKRLIIPFFLWGYLFMLPIKRISDYYDSDSFVKALKTFWRGYDPGHLWFLPALFWCLLIFALIVKVIDSFKILDNKSYFKTLIVLVISILIRVGIVFIPREIWFIKQGLGNIIYFAIGYAFEREIRCKNRLNIKAWMISLILLIVVEVTNFRFGYLSGEIVAISGCLLIYSLCILLDRFCKEFFDKPSWKLLIRNLFYVYLIHDPLEYVVLKVYFSNNLLTSDLWCAAFYPIRVIVLFVVSLLLGEAVNRIKKAFASHIAL